MRKEVLIAIIIGFGLGLIITFGIWTANKALKETAPTTTAPAEEKVETKPTPAPTLELTIVSPKNNTISDQELIEVSGQTIPQAIVAITYPEGEKLLEADEDGSFSTEISLIGGDNQIKISAFNDEGDEATESLTIVYSTAEI
ncbi:hypothetical protein A2Z41_02950 [Microgenomates group bacterium RBG_19FT_COMBO_39_10]|nr:MAG: hypothetical protein A2Z41_02950 [Microgenomates group bacterium RBG_19FT_COMBO_39_10]